MAAMMPKPTEEELAAPVNYMYCTAIPIGTALAQSFSTKICEALGDMVGEEMEMFGVQLWLGTCHEHPEILLFAEEILSTIPRIR